MQNTIKPTDTRRTLGELGDYEDGRNFGSPQNSKNLTDANLSPLKLKDLEPEIGALKFGGTSPKAPAVQGFKK